MGILQDELDRVVRELCADKGIKAELIRSVFAARGISLTDEEFEILAEAIDKSDGSDTIEVSIERVTGTIDISEGETERAWREFEGKLEARVTGAIERVLEKITPSVLETLYASLPETLEEHRSVQADFETRLQERWKGGLDRLEMLIIIAHEAGETYLGDVRKEFAGDSQSEKVVLLEALVPLHCRACRTAREIVCLLKSGYADGAYARWRALHEMAVTAFFLLEHGADTAQRYLDHVAVRCWRAARDYQRHCETLGYETLSSEELGEVKAASDTMTDKYGSSFGGDYGWAARAIGHNRPTFRMIEESLDMAHWRPFFGMACRSVHAGPESLFFSLGATEEVGAKLLAGASDAGLADPGHHAAVSLTMVSVALLTATPNMDALVSCRCMLKICDEIGEALLKAQGAE